MAPEEKPEAARRQTKPRKRGNGRATVAGLKATVEAGFKYQQDWMQRMEQRINQLPTKAEMDSAITASYERAIRKAGEMDRERGDRGGGAGGSPVALQVPEQSQSASVVSLPLPRRLSLIEAVVRFYDTHQNAVAIGTIIGTALLIIGAALWQRNGGPPWKGPKP